MNNQYIIELEKILNQEIETYSKLEECINEKKDSLIKGDIEKLGTVDAELEKYNMAVKKLEEKRAQIYPDNLTLREIIDRIENREQAEKISSMREKIKTSVLNIQKQNTINNELLKHSLKIVENTIIFIAKALMPEGSAYNQKGASRTGKNLSVLSSVEHEA